MAISLRNSLPTLWRLLRCARNDGDLKSCNSESRNRRGTSSLGANLNRLLTGKISGERRIISNPPRHCEERSDAAISMVIKLSYQ